MRRNFNIQIDALRSQKEFTLRNEQVLIALSILKPQEQDVIIARCGWADGVPRTYEQVARKYKVNRECVRYIQNRALHKIKGLL